jgi:hypothetical protein
MYRPQFQEVAVVTAIIIVFGVALVQLVNFTKHAEFSLHGAIRPHGTQYPPSHGFGGDTAPARFECDSCESCVDALLKANKVANERNVYVYVVLTRDIGTRNGSCIRVSGLHAPHGRLIFFDGNGRTIYVVHFNPSNSPAVEINSAAGVVLKDMNVQMYDYAGSSEALRLSGVSHVILDNLFVSFHGSGGSALRIEHSSDVTLHEVAVPTEPSGDGVVLYDSDSCRLDGVSIAYLDKQMTRDAESFWADTAAPLIISFSDDVSLKRIRIFRQTLGPAIYLNFSNAMIIADSYSYLCNDANWPLIESHSSDLRCGCYSGTIYWHSLEGNFPTYCPCAEKMEFNTCKKEVEEWVQCP